MKKFQKIELWLCMIPGLSTLFIGFATMFIIKKHPHRFLHWILFALIFFGGGFVAFALPRAILWSGITILEYLLQWCIFTVINVLFIKLQQKCIQGEIPRAVSDS